MWRQRQHLTGTQQLRIIITNAKNIHDDQEPYSKNACERALENHGNYVARINAFWVNHLRSPSPGIPLRRESVKEFADFLWPPESTEAPAVLLELLEVQAPVTIPDIPSELQIISPEGYIHALLLACARDLPRNLDKWKIILKSVPCAFTKGEGWSLPGDVWIRAWNSRNKISQAYESLSRTAFQTCMEIMSVKSKIEAELARSLTAAELVQELKNRGLKKASSQDEMTVNLVTHGLLIAERMQGEHLGGDVRDEQLPQQDGVALCPCEQTIQSAKCLGDAEFVSLRPHEAGQQRGCDQGLPLGRQKFSIDDQPLGAQGLGVGSALGVHAGQSKAGGQGHHYPEAGAGQSRGLPCPHVGRRCGPARPARTIQFGGPGRCRGSGVRNVMLGTWLYTHPFISPWVASCLFSQQKLVYSKHYDNAMKACCRGNKNVDDVMELPQIKKDWDRMVACRENELVNEQAKRKTEDEAGPADEEAPLAVLRKPPTDFKEHSLPYWKAMANTSVRRYVTFAVKPGTQSQMTRLVSQSALKDIVLNEGSKYFVVFMHLVSYV